MKIPVIVDRQPGLFSTLGYPESLLHVPRFVASTAIAPSELFDALADFQSAELETHLKWPFSNTAEKLKQLFSQKFPVRVLSTQSEYIPVATHELHCPRISGALGSLKVQKSEEKSASCKV